MMSLSAEAVTYREGLISVKKNHSSRFTKDRKIKQEDIICRANKQCIFWGEQPQSAYQLRRLERTCAEKPKEEACTIDRINSATNYIYS